MKFNVHNYDDIINIKKPKSNHKQMDRLQRASQFAPFAVLKGYEESIFETGRIVNNKIELSQEQKDEISYKLIYLQEHIKDNIEVEVIYFISDKKKHGGTYQSKIGIIRKINDIEKQIQFFDKSLININDIYEIKVEELDKNRYLFTN